MEAISQFPYPLQHCKILHMARHAQGIHNVEAEKNRDALLSPDLFDAPISLLGRQQVAELRKQVVESGLFGRIELVLTSPLLRTMQTAVEVFGSDDYKTLNCPPIIALEICRDRLGVRPCDKRRTITECRSLFPTIDFSLMESEDDNLWDPYVREAYEDIEARGLKFMKWLWTRQEKEIAVVSHGVVLQHMLMALANDCDPSVRNELCKRFDNCELRSVVLVDKSAMASDASEAQSL